jgi:hypothetical protein
MDFNGTIALVSAVAAAASAFVAIFAVRRSAAIATDANEIAVVAALHNEFRTSAFRKHLGVALSAPEGAPEAGFGGLGDRAESAYTVCYFFEYLGQLIALRNVPDEFVLDMMGTQIVGVWLALEAFIDGERRVRDRTLPPDVSRRFLPHYEHMVCRALNSARAAGPRPVGGVELLTRTEPLQQRRTG